MVRLIHLLQDQTFIEKNVKVSSDKIRVSKDYLPSYSPTSVFRERPLNIFSSILQFWRKRRTIIILYDKCPSALDVKKIDGKPALNLEFGTEKDAKDFITKMILKSLKEHKPVSNTQFMVICGFLGIIIALLLAVLSGVKL